MKREDGINGVSPLFIIAAGARELGQGQRENFPDAPAPSYKDLKEEVLWS